MDEREYHRAMTQGLGVPTPSAQFVPQNSSAAQLQAMREATAREIIEIQLRGAEQEVLDLRTILSMLPAEMTPSQDAALRRTLTRRR